MSLTNEGGVDGTVRFLSNVMGTWLLSETLRTWGETDLHRRLLRAAEAYDVPVPVVDVQDQPFLPPGDMEARISEWCPEHEVAPPNGRVSLVRCIVRASRPPSDAAEPGGRPGPTPAASCTSSAAAPRTPSSARRSPTARGPPVLAGPVEATALGNVLVQARAAGVVGPGLADLRALVARTHDLMRFSPRAEKDRAVRVALMVTCINDALFPDTGRAVVTLLRRLGVEVDFPEAQTCCGQPMVNTGYLDEAVPPLRSFVEGLRRVRRDRHAAGSCAGSARHQRDRREEDRATPRSSPPSNGPRPGPTS